MAEAGTIEPLMAAATATPPKRAASAASEPQDECTTARKRDRKTTSFFAGQVMVGQTYQTHDNAAATPPAKACKPRGGPGVGRDSCGDDAVKESQSSGDGVLLVPTAAGSTSPAHKAARERRAPGGSAGKQKKSEEESEEESEQESDEDWEMDESGSPPSMPSSSSSSSSSKKRAQEEQEDDWAPPKAKQKRAPARPKKPSAAAAPTNMPPGAAPDVASPAPAKPSFGGKGGKRAKAAHPPRVYPCLGTVQGGYTAAHAEELSIVNNGESVLVTGEKRGDAAWVWIARVLPSGQLGGSGLVPASCIAFEGSAPAPEVAAGGGGGRGGKAKKVKLLDGTL